LRNITRAANRFSIDVRAPVLRKNIALGLEPRIVLMDEEDRAAIRGDNTAHLLNIGSK
jgi:hypothetical protein